MPHGVGFGRIRRRGESPVVTDDGASVALTLVGHPVPVRVRLDARLSPLVTGLFKGWTVTTETDTDAPPQIEMMSADDGAVTVRGPWVGHDYRVRDKADIARSFIAEIIKAQANEAVDHLCIHAASVLFADHAVLLAGDFRSGKSTLTAVLAARGVTVVGDDAVFIDAERGVAVGPGIAPRLRLPLPAGLSDQTNRFVRQALGLTGRQYGYLTLQGQGLLDNGAEAEIGAFVFLNRVAGQRATLVDVSRSEAFRQMIWHNFARQAPADRILAAMSDMVMPRPAVELRYDNAEEAADLLQRTFAAWPQVIAAWPSNPAPDANRLPAIEPRLWRADPQIEEREVDNTTFLADPNTGRIFHLNATAAAIWKMLAAGDRHDDITRVIAETFPRIAASRIAGDVDKLAIAFRENGLLLADNPPPLEARDLAYREGG